MLHVKVKKFLTSLAVVLVVSSVLYATDVFAETVEKKELFSDLMGTGSKIFMGLRDIVFAVSGFGIVAVAVAGFFGNINYKWLTAIISGLVVIAVTAGILNYMTESSGGSTYSNITDTLVTGSDNTRSEKVKE